MTINEFGQSTSNWFHEVVQGIINWFPNDGERVRAIGDIGIEFMLLGVFVFIVYRVVRGRIRDVKEAELALAHEDRMIKKYGSREAWEFHEPYVPYDRVWKILDGYYDNDPDGNPSIGDLNECIIILERKNRKMVERNQSMRWWLIVAVSGAILFFIW